MSGVAIREKRVPALGQESGLTLIELMVAMLLFLIVMAGVAGTLAAGLQATLHSNIQTIGKSVAQEQIEEMRSRIFFVPYSASADTGTRADIDLLDDYFPNLRTTPSIDSRGWRGWYDAGKSSYVMESPPRTGTGIVLTVETHFVDSARGTVTPNAGYDSDLEGQDTPPSNLVVVMVRASWSDRSGPNSYQLDSLIGGTAQTVQGAGDAGGEQGCISNSNSEVISDAGGFRISTGTDAALTQFIEGEIGEARASLFSGCETGSSSSINGSRVALFEATSQSFAPIATGADVFAFAPAGQESIGPLSDGTSSGWPSAHITDSRADAMADDTVQVVSAESETSVSQMSVSLEQIDGWYDDPVIGYRRWDFINPLISVTGGSDPQEFDPRYQDDQGIAFIEQLGGITSARGKVYIRQIEIMPLEAKTADTPSARQGLIFVRDFRAEVVSEAGGASGVATNPVKTYSATIGLFDATRSADCAGDDCYDLYATSGPDNPIRTAISLSGTQYGLQRALLTGFESLTAREMQNSSVTSPQGTSASFSFNGGSIRIDARYGDEVRWKIDNPQRDQITLVNQRGAMQLWLGEISTSVHQE